MKTKLIIPALMGLTLFALALVSCDKQRNQVSDKLATDAQEDALDAARDAEDAARKAQRAADDAAKEQAEEARERAKKTREATR